MFMIALKYLYYTNSLDISCIILFCAEPSRTAALWWPTAELLSPTTSERRILTPLSASHRHGDLATSFDEFLFLLGVLLY